MLRGGAASGKNGKTDIEEIEPPPEPLAAFRGGEDLMPSRRFMRSPRHMDWIFFRVRRSFRGDETITTTITVMVLKSVVVDSPKDILPSNSSAPR